MTIESFPINLEDIDAIIKDNGTKLQYVIPILQKIQEKYNFLPEPALHRICETTDITPADITGVMSFYTQFRDKPAGKHIVRVCIGTACHVKGAKNITDAFRRYLQIEDEHDTDGDGLFTVGEVACLGCCMLAPAVQIDDVIYGFVDSQKVGSVLSDFLASRMSMEESRKLGSAAGDDAVEIRICQCSSCQASGSGAVYKEIICLIDEYHLNAKIKAVGCTGISYQAPLVEIEDFKGEIFRYGLVKAEDVNKIILHHIKPSGWGSRVRNAVTGMLERILTDRSHEPVTRYSVDIRNGPDGEFTSCQNRIATKYSGELDPLDLEEYCRNGGLEALKECLQNKKPEGVIRIVSDSGLRGRGGAGFPTGNKWKIVKDAVGSEKYLICNGDEGDPGAFMDRMLLESFPFRVLEGIIIGGYAAGLSAGYIYIRSEYPLAVKRVTGALEILKETGWLGDNIQGLGYSFDLKLVQGAGAFVCGEETALISAIEGSRGMPRLRPPYPSEKGLFGCPTMVNNVETFALVPSIITNGASFFNELGTDSSKGTKSFALAGKINRGGLIEVPMGITIRQIVEKIGGGIQEGRTFKAIQIGGPSGGCVPASLADTPIDYEALVSAGAIMGSGGLVVLDETDCMVDIAKYFLTFTQRESCGKCTYCRIGTKRMLEILERITDGEGKEGDIEKLEELAIHIRKGSLCGLGRTAPNPVLSTIRHFRDEYEIHIKGRCPAGKCKGLITYRINDTCIGCTKCSQVCPAEAIEMDPYKKHEIDPEKCIRCDSCYQVCPSDAVEVN